MRQIIKLNIHKVFRVVDRYHTDGEAHWTARLDCTHRIEGWEEAQGSTLAEIAANVQQSLIAREHYCPHCIPNEADQADRLFRTTYLGITKAVAAYNGHRHDGWSYTLADKFPEMFDE